MPRTLTSALGVLLALALLDLLLTFHNVWPTPWVHPVPELSVELAALVLLLAMACERTTGLGRRWRWAIVAVLFLLVLGRYADVTAPALFGRPIDLYWDAPHLPDAVAMVAAVARPSELAVTVLAVAAGAAVLIAGLVWAVATLERGFAHGRLRRGTAALSLSLLALYGAGKASARLDSEYWFSIPVTGVYGRQAELLIENLRPDSPAKLLARQAMRPSDLGRLAGSDVFLLFFESYGATVFEAPQQRAAMAATFERAAAELERGGWRAASAYVDSPTFGGVSWLAHASLLSGLRIAQPRDYQAFLKSDRETLIGRFKRAGYHTVALVPGIKYAWPEGEALGFDRVHDAAEIAYRGPAFGWWTIPDQYSLEWLYRTELAAPKGGPLFVFFPMISSHMPFQPVPPYQPEWSRLFSPMPYDTGVPPPAAAGASPANLTRAYAEAVRYDIETLAGFLRERAPRNALILVLGDHQPPAVVSGQGASWSVPVHVMARRGELLAPFLAAGFSAGLRPRRPSLGGMEGLTDLLLGAFDSRTQTAAQPAAGAAR